MSTVLIAGANRGIGLAIAQQYATEFAEVFACCRAPAKADDLKALAASSGGRVRIIPLEVAEESLIASLKYPGRSASTFSSTMPESAAYRPTGSRPKVT
ncbi:hypothetical protein CVM73_35395 [Bradyrhizobium forestalis]|uniref:Short-chain dehydrogenase n=1 Tax=Bradyrhizobium forestalis TaxID=1419263 RepID=A0A2M8QYH2_9BRAD|nr:SDR family NAD(P)-dependent oxidoreductase [Bradyrhizobium forestalis]PJG50599.1 hypothetical protein CVM73_35395 [Bradyrhizobium forestalis]